MTRQGALWSYWRCEERVGTPGRLQANVLRRLAGILAVDVAGHDRFAEHNQAGLDGLLALRRERIDPTAHDQVCGKIEAESRTLASSSFARLRVSGAAA